MVRLRGSLALLEHAPSSKSALNQGSPLSLLASLPDFLVPSFRQSPATKPRRHHASIARAGFEESPHKASSRSDSSSSTLIERNSRSKKACSQSVKPHGVDFRSNLHLYPPTTAPLHKFPAAASVRADAKKADIKARLDEAKDEQELAAAANKIFNWHALKAERADLQRRNSETEPSLQLNEQFLLSLLVSSRCVTRQSGKNDLDGMDALVAAQIRRVAALVPPDAFSIAFLSRCATRVSCTSNTRVLDQIFSITQDQIEVAATSSARSYDAKASQSRMLLFLMRGYSQAARPDRVRACFNTLQIHALPASILHYQMQLIALFREHVSVSLTQDQVNFKTQQKQVEADVLEIKRHMDTNGVPVDDTFMATIINGLSAPLRSPLATRSSTAQALGALRLIRTVVGQLTGQSRRSGLNGMPRLLYAVTSAELYAIQYRVGEGISPTEQALDRVKDMIKQLEKGKESMPASYHDAAAFEDGKPISESKLAAMSLRLRLLGTQGLFMQALPSLRRILELEFPSQIEIEARKLRRELILKQRSAVIYLFSAALQQRQKTRRHDAAFEVLKLAFDEKWFDRVWTGVYYPRNPYSRYDSEDYHGEGTVFRLWKRWIPSWFRDTLAEGTRTGVVEGQAVTEGNERRYSTWVGRNHWQALKEGLTLFNQTTEQYERRLGIAWTPDQAVQPHAPSLIARYATLFSDPVGLDTMVRSTIRSTRIPRGEKTATHVNRRLNLLIQTLTRVRAPARIWEQVEKSMKKHTASIDPEHLPIESVEEAMDLINLRKQQALLRDPNILEALAQIQHEREQYVPETGSITVLRQMLNMREARKRELTSSASTSPVLT